MFSEDFIELTIKPQEEYLKGEEQEEKKKVRKIEIETFKYGTRGFYAIEDYEDETYKYVDLCYEEGDLRFWLREGVDVKFLEGKIEFSEVEEKEQSEQPNNS